MSKANKKKNDDAEEDYQPVALAEQQLKNIIDEESDFDINPLKKKCNYCNVEVVTYVEHEGHPFFLLGAIIVFVVFGFLSVVILPIAYLVTKNAVHRCSRCLQKLGEKQCFGIPTNVKDEIWTIRLGKCSVVLSRGYGIAILIIFSLLSMYYVYLRPSVFSHMQAYETPKDSKVVDYTWEEFLQDCGGEVIVENYVHARSVFNKKYEANIVTWTGYYAETKQAQQFPFMHTDHAMNVLIKMEPTESSVYPDLVLSISSDLLKNKKTEVFDIMKKGDEIKYRAKIMNLGNEFKMHHFHALDLEITGKHKELNEIIIKESALP